MLGKTTVILAPENAAEFTGFLPVRPVGRRFDLYQLLPTLNRREDETGDLRRFLACLQEVTDLVVHDVDRFTDVFDPDLAPEAFIDAMLLDLGNPFPFDLSPVDKRRLLNVLVAIYREKGTAVGIDISLDTTQAFSLLLDHIRESYRKAVRERKKARYKKARFI